MEKVRRLMVGFDGVDVSPDLSAYGTEGTTEANQYFLLDEIGGVLVRLRIWIGDF